MLRKIDDVIFDTFPSVQRLVNLVEYMTSMTQITQVRLLNVFGTAYSMSHSYRDWLVGEWLGMVGMFGSFLILIICFGILIPAANLIYKRSHGTRNPLRVAQWMMVYRIYLLSAFMYKLFVESSSENPRYVWVVTFLCVFLAVYIAACDNLPPGQRFIDRFRKRVPA